MSGQDEARQLRRRACCLTGHRALPSDPDERMELTHNLRKTVARLAQEGIQVFYTGGALGFDTLAAVPADSAVSGGALPWTKPVLVQAGHPPVRAD